MSHVSVWETILIYVVIPLAVYLVVFLPVMASGNSRMPRYKPGQQWPYEPVWWSANPAAQSPGHGAAQSHEGQQGEDVELIRTARGGARGSW